MLAVFAPVLGMPSETFITRHMLALCPGRTVVVVDESPASLPDAFSGIPILALDNVVSGTRPVPLPWRRRTDTDRLKREAVRAFLHKHKVRSVLGEYLNSSVHWLRFTQSMGCHAVGHAHGWDVSAALRDEAVRRSYLHYNDLGGVVTMSEFSRQVLIRAGVQENKISVIPYGIDVPSDFPERPPREPVRCLAVGRMVAKKAPILLLESFRQALARGVNLHLDVIGAGPLFPAAQQFVRAFQLQDRITLHGESLHAFVFSAMQDADIFIQHSITDEQSGDTEGLPVAILEAMAYGLPVVSTRHAGIPESVVDGETGWLVDEGNTAGMGDAIARLAKDVGLRKNMGKAGFHRVQDAFTWRQEKENLLNVLNLSQ